MSTSIESQTTSLAELSQPRLHELLEQMLDRSRAEDHARRLAMVQPVDLDMLIAHADSSETLAHELGKLSIVPVMTSHPSEMRPPAVLAALAQCHDANDAYTALRALPTRVNIERPAISDEVATLIGHFERVLFDALADFYEKLEEAANRRFGAAAPPIPSIYRFHSWVGCDRDGNPECTAAATLETAGAMHRCIVERYRRDLAHLATICEPGALAGIAQLLGQLTIEGDVCTLSAHAFALRLEQLATCVRDQNAQRHVRRLQRLFATFGFHLATLEWRQHSDYILFAFDERDHSLYPKQLRLHELQPQFRLARIIASLYGDCELADYEHLLTTPKAVELVQSLRALATIRARYGAAAVGEIIISNCEDATVIFALERLARDAGVFAAGEIAIVPLFESLSALTNGPRIVTEALCEPSFRAKIARLNNRFEIMVGYSDAAKDGGRIAADFLIRRAQHDITSAALAFRVTPRFFHGRGGSHGRGAADFTESVAIADARIAPGEIKITEQGEVVFNRYGHPALAAHSLKAWFAASLQQVRRYASKQIDAEASDLEFCIASECSHVFRKLREDAAFMEMVRALTQLDLVRSFPLSSRPASRTTDRHTKIDLAALRAVPFNIAFNVSLAQVPAWYGTGSGLAKAQELFGVDSLRSAYAVSALFRASVDRAFAALSLSNLELMRSRCSNDDEAQFVAGLESEDALARRIVADLRREACPPARLLYEANGLADVASFLQSQAAAADAYAARLGLATLATSIGMTG